MATGAAFGGGGDPLGLVNRGVEGSGAAQIFDRSTAVNDFVQQGKARELAKQKAEEKKKAEKDKALNQALEFDYQAWQQADGKPLADEYGEIVKEGATLMANGINPKSDPNFLKRKNDFILKANISKEEFNQYAEFTKKLNDATFVKGYDPEVLKSLVGNADAFMKLPTGQRDPNLLRFPAIEKPIDYEKAVAQDVKNLPPNTTTVPDYKSGVFITKKEVPAEEIESKLKGFKTSEAYKQKTKSLVDDGTFATEDEAKEFLDQDYKIRFYKNVGMRSISKSQMDIKNSFGSGVANTYKAEYRNVRPSDINVSNYGIKPDEIIIGGSKAPYLRSISLLSSDKKSPVPLSFSTNIKYKDANGNDVPLTSSTPVYPKQLIEYKAVNGNKYLFIFNLKGFGDAAAVIDSGNKEDFETYFLPEGETIETFLDKGEGGSKIQTNTQSNTTTTTSKFDKYKRK